MCNHFDTGFLKEKKKQKPNTEALQAGQRK